jgi:hypothetical protein
MSFLEINVENTLYIARVYLGLAGLTHTGQWGALYLRLVGLTRVVRLFGCLASTLVAEHHEGTKPALYVYREWIP